MTKPVRIAVGILGTFVFLLILAVIVIKVVFTKERVLAILTPRIEQMIDRPVSIADAGITLWPGIAVRVEGINVGNPPGFAEEPMVRIGRLDIRARFWPLLVGKVKIDRIVLDRPYVLVEYASDGRSNFDGMLKRDTVAVADTTGNEPDRLSVALVDVVNARVLYRNPTDSLWADLHEADAEIMLNTIDRDILVFVGNIAFDSLILRLNGREFAVRAGEPSLYLDASWNRLAKTLRVDSAIAEWWSAQLAFAGQIRSMPSLHEISVNARLASARVERLIDEIDPVYPLPKFANLTGAMNGNLEARFVWPLPDGAVPDWQGRFEVTGVEWPLPETEAIVTIPRVELRGNERSVSWTAMSGQITGGTFSTSGTLDQLFTEQKTFSARLQGQVPLDGARGLLPESWKADLRGDLDFDLTGFGSVDDWTAMNVNGRITTNRLLVSHSDWDFDSLSTSAECQLTGHGVQMVRCDWIAGDSRGKLTGRIDDLLPAILSDFTAPDVPHGQLDVTSPYLNLDGLIGDAPVETSSDRAGSKPGDVPLLSITGTITGNTVIYNGLPITTASAPYTYRDRVLALAPISGSVFGGRLAGSLGWNLNTWPQPEFSASMTADSIESNDFLSRYLGWAGGAFGQVSISGDFSGKGRHATQIVPTLIARGRIDGTEVRLESAPLLAKVGQAIGVQGMDRPRSLRDLHQPFRIENGRVFTDSLHLDFGDASYTAMGSFGFDQTLDYHVAAAATTPSGPLILQGVGLNFTLGGTVTSPSVSIDVAGTARDVYEKTLDQASDTLQKTLEQKLKDILGPGKP